MYWVLWALCGMIAVSITRILTKNLLYTYSTSLVTMVQFLIGAICSILATNTTLSFSSVQIWTVLSGIATGFTTYFLNKSYNYVTNPGLPFMVYRLETILTTILSYLIFTKSVALNTKKLVAMTVMIASLGVLVISTPKSQEEKGAENFQSTDISSNVAKSILKPWVGYAILSALSCAIMILTTKKVLLHSGDTDNHTTFQLIFAALTIIIVYIYSQSNDDSNIDLDTINTDDLLKLLGVGFGYFGFIYSLNRSVKISPNPGYSKSIVAGSTLIVPFVSQYLFRNSFLNIQQWVAMFFSIGAMGYIAQPTKEELKMEHCH